MVYFAPLASFPLMALAQQTPDNQIRTDNPYVVALMIFIVALTVSVALISYFRLQNRGRIRTCVILGLVDWLITAPITMSAGVKIYMSLAIATLSSAVLAFLVFRFGKSMALFFRRQEAANFDTDKD
jgi:uncharacterized membrane protein YesL